MIQGRGVPIYGGFMHSDDWKVYSNRYKKCQCDADHIRRFNRSLDGSSGQFIASNGFWSTMTLRGPPMSLFSQMISTSGDFRLSNQIRPRCIDLSIYFRYPSPEVVATPIRPYLIRFILIQRLEKPSSVDNPDITQNKITWQNDAKSVIDRTKCSPFPRPGLPYRFIREWFNWVRPSAEGGELTDCFFIQEHIQLPEDIAFMTYDLADNIAAEEERGGFELQLYGEPNAWTPSDPALRIEHVISYENVF